MEKPLHQPKSIIRMCGCLWTNEILWRMAWAVCPAPDQQQNVRKTWSKEQEAGGLLTVGGRGQRRAGCLAAGNCWIRRLPAGAAEGLNQLDFNQREALMACQC